MRTAVLLAFAVALSAGAAPVPKSLKKKTDAELLEGRWESVSFDIGGGPRTDITWWLEVRDGKLSTGTRQPPGYDQRVIRLDSTTCPKQLDIDNAAGAFNLGIYELEGDTFVWCESTAPTVRPTDFKAGNACSVFVYKRMKSKE